MPADANKATLRFETAHQPGSLASALDIFRQRGINLTKIQSVPILGKPYQYSIHVDLEWDSHENYLAAIGELQRRASQVQSFGEYKRGERPVA
jgi:prephenate dehydratase